MLKELNLLVFISLKDFHGHFLLDKRKTRNMNDCIHIISTGKVVIRKFWVQNGSKLGCKVPCACFGGSEMS